MSFKLGDIFAAPVLVTNGTESRLIRRLKRAAGIVMCSGGSIHKWLLVCLACLIFGLASELPAAENYRFVCFDANATPAIKTSACTQVINATETSDEIRLAAYLNRAAANYLLGNLDAAIRDYSEFISVQPSNAVALHERGLAYLMASQFLNAIADFSASIQLNSKYARVYNNRGIAYFKIKEHQKALSDFDVAIQIDPSYTAALYNRSLIYFDNAKYDLAVVDLKKAIEIQPANPDLYNQLAWTYLKMGFTSEGLEYVNRSLALKPSAKAYDTRGAIYEKIGEVKRAVDDYGRALALDQSLSTSAQALKRLSAKDDAWVQNAKVAALMSELVQLAETHGRQVDMGRMCALMNLNSQRSCRFKQIAVSPDAQNTLDNNGFNVPEAKDAQYVVIFHLGPLVGNFFVVSLDGNVKSAFFRSKGVDYTEIPVAESRAIFEEALKFWMKNLEAIKRMIPAGDLRK